MTPELFGTTPTFGVSLPHFGRVGRDAIVAAAKQAEDLGFAAVWVRDHLATRVPSDVGEGAVFVDGMVALAAVAVQTERIGLGLAAMTLHRYPLNAAAVLSSIDFLAGGNRVVAGIGLGASEEEARATRMEEWDRREVVEEYVAVLRNGWSGGTDFSGKYYEYQDLAVTPHPEHGIWVSYCGTSKAAVRRSVEYCDSWGPVKLPIWLFEQYSEHLANLIKKSGTDVVRPTLASSLVSVADTEREALERMELGARLKGAAKRFPAPPSGAYTSWKDLEGLVLAGPPEVIAQGAQRYLDAGASHFVFDLRDSVEDWTELTEMIATEVIPRINR